MNDKSSFDEKVRNWWSRNIRNVQNDRFELLVVWYYIDFESVAESIESQSRIVYRRYRAPISKRASKRYVAQAIANVNCRIHSNDDYLTDERKKYLKIEILNFESRFNKCSILQCKLSFIVFKFYKWRHLDTTTTLIRRSVHLSNMLFTHLHFCEDILEEFVIVANTLKKQQSKEHALVMIEWTKQV